MLDISKLEHTRFRGDKLIAACPACRAAGNDSKGDHLIVYRGEDGTHEQGVFGCVANEGDAIHRSHIFSLVGVREYTEHCSKKEQAKRVRLATQRAKQRNAQELESELITQRIAQSLESRLAPYLVKHWRGDLLDRSPILFDCPNVVQHDFVRCLYQSDDILWLGDLYDTGEAKHGAHFLTCSEWLEMAVLPPRIAPATFKAGVFSRSSLNVKSSPFIIIESDDLIGRRPESLDDKERNKALSHALISYAQDKLGLTLRAVIDTGNKSLHSWFDRPPPAALDAIKKMAAGLRIDQSALNQGHYPFRMPDCIHDKTNQPARLLYLNPTHS